MSDNSFINDESVETGPRLATIERIKEVLPHPNADLLELVKVKGFTAIVKKGAWKAGDLCVFVQPDSQLPDVPWASFYRAKSSRIKAIRLRSVWSEGVVESFENTGYAGPIDEGLDITNVLGVIKYEAPQPQDLSAKGGLPYGICKTDEERAANLDVIPYGEIVDVLQKIDGQSCSFYWLIDNELEQSGVLGRTMEYKGECLNKYTQNQANHDAINKISAFCRKHNVPGGICVRGESYGSGLQGSAHNPHSKLPLSWAMFSIWLIGERRYANKGDPFYFLNIAEELRLPTVPVVERDVVLTPELIHKYSEGIEKLNGQPFEGVVVQGKFGSFKIISKSYDAKK
jgi:RNA ligase (TIGR02306 family)